MTRLRSLTSAALIAVVGPARWVGRLSPFRSTQASPTAGFGIRFTPRAFHLRRCRLNPGIALDATVSLDHVLLVKSGMADAATISGLQLLRHFFEILPPQARMCSSAF